MDFTYLLRCRRCILGICSLGFSCSRIVCTPLLRGFSRRLGGRLVSLGLRCDARRPPRSCGFRHLRCFCDGVWGEGGGRGPQRTEEGRTPSGPGVRQLRACPLQPSAAAPNPGPRNCARSSHHPQFRRMFVRSQVHFVSSLATTSVIYLAERGLSSVSHPDPGQLNCVPSVCLSACGTP